MTIYLSVLHVTTFPSPGLLNIVIYAFVEQIPMRYELHGRHYLGPGDVALNKTQGTLPPRGLQSR